jgi:nitroreductase
MSNLNLSADQVLTTTRAVRKRMDFDRDVEMDVLRECFNIALQGPSGSNSQGWQFMLVTDKDKIAAIAEWYLKSFDVYQAGPASPTKQHQDRPEMKDTQQKVENSARYLADNLHKVPALLIPVFGAKLNDPALPHSAQASMYGSILPSVWSFMLAARERGLGTCWTTLHLNYEQEIANILGIPFDTHSQLALIPIAYTKGTDFKPAPRKPLDEFLHINEW